MKVQMNDELIQELVEQPKKKPVKWTIELYKAEVDRITDGEYTVLGEEYVNANTGILMRHNAKDCGHEWSPMPSGFLRGTRCPKCAVGTRRLTLDEYKQRVYDVVGNEYTVLGKEYINANKEQDKIEETIHRLTALQTSIC